MRDANMLEIIESSLAPQVLNFFHTFNEIEYSGNIKFDTLKPLVRDNIMVYENCRHYYKRPNKSIWKSNDGKVEIAVENIVRIDERYVVLEDKVTDYNVETQKIKRRKLNDEVIDDEKEEGEYEENDKVVDVEEKVNKNENKEDVDKIVNEKGINKGVNNDIEFEMPENKSEIQYDFSAKLKVFKERFYDFTDVSKQQQYSLTASIEMPLSDVIIKYVKKPVKIFKITYWHLLIDELYVFRVAFRKNLKNEKIHCNIECETQSITRDNFIKYFQLLKQHYIQQNEIMDIIEPLSEKIWTQLLENLSIRLISREEANKIDLQFNISKIEKKVYDYVEAETQQTLTWIYGGVDD